MQLNDYGKITDECWRAIPQAWDESTDVLNPTRPYGPKTKKIPSDTHKNKRHSPPLTCFIIRRAITNYYVPHHYLLPLQILRRGRSLRQCILFRGKRRAARARGSEWHWQDHAA